MLVYCFWEMWRECQYDTLIDQLIFLILSIIITPALIIIDSILAPIELIIYIILKHRDKQVDKEFEDLGGK